jgi:hypothetical protein
MAEERGQRAIQVALDELEALGVDREHVLLAFVDPTPDEKGDTSYWTHVGRTEDPHDGTLLDMVANDLKREAHEQSQAVFRGIPCPACGSPRYAARQDGKDFPKVHFYDQCMDCGHRSPNR